MISKYQAHKNHQMAVEKTLVEILVIGITLVIVMLIVGGV